MNASFEDTVGSPVMYLINLELVRKVWLIILSILIVPSTFCSLMMLFWMSHTRDLWTRLTNHIIIANFLVNFIQVRVSNVSHDRIFSMLLLCHIAGDVDRIALETFSTVEYRYLHEQRRERRS